jgi:hypothetical protein
MTATTTCPDTPTANDRDANGRFAKGNPGGPGNPYYRRQAQLKRQLLASVSEDDVQAVMQVLVGLAKSGDLAAIKLFLEYTVGKPRKEVDPDQEELHEWQLQQQTPRVQQVLETMTYSIETPRANQVVRDMIPLVGDCHLQTISQHVRDGTGYDGQPIAPPLDPASPPPDRNGGKRSSAAARCMTAGIRATDLTGDNGGVGDPELELARAYFAGEIGIEDLNRYYRNAGARPNQPHAPGPECQ